VKKLASDLNVSLMKLRSDPSPAVAGWASYLCATTEPKEQAGAVAAEMAKSADWPTRLLSLYVGAPNQKELAASLTGDADPTIRAAATATTELIQSPTTHPATQPASAPAGQ
jgi:hypothetical protein